MEELQEYKAIIGSNAYDLSISELAEIDLIDMDTRGWHLIYKGHSHNLTGIEVDIDNKTVSLLIDGKKMMVHLKDSFDLKIHRLGLDIGKATTNGLVNAPMPGLVLDTLVQEGDDITKGQPLLILEAMKMENVIKSDYSGVLTRMLCHTGDKVDKGQLLIDISPSHE